MKIFKAILWSESLGQWRDVKVYRWTAIGVFAGMGLMAWGLKISSQGFFHLFLRQFGDYQEHRLLLMRTPVLIFLLVIPFFFYMRLVSALNDFLSQDDNELLRASPVSSEVLFLRNLVVGSRGVLIFFFMIIYPIWIGYRSFHQLSISTDLVFIFCVFLSSIPSQVLGIVLPLTLVRLSKKVLPKQFFIAIGLMFFVALWFFVRSKIMASVNGISTLDRVLDAMIFVETQNPVIDPFFWPARILIRSIEAHRSAWIHPLLLPAIAFNFAVFALGWIWVKLFYATCLSIAEESRGHDPQQSRRSSARVFMLNRPALSIAYKDWIAIVREPSYWTQMILLLIFFFAYWKAYQRIPVDASNPDSQIILKIQGPFMIATLGLLQAAMAARFVFPLVSLEAKALSLLKSSPCPPRSIILGKLALGFVILWAASALESWVLGVLTFKLLLILAGMAASISGMGMWCGTYWPKFQVKSLASFQVSLGGLLFSILCVGIIGMSSVISSLSTMRALLIQMVSAALIVGGCLRFAPRKWRVLSS